VQQPADHPVDHRVVARHDHVAGAVGQRGRRRPLCLLGSADLLDVVLEAALVQRRTDRGQLAPDAAPVRAGVGDDAHPTER
jgi:hypothetical protein